MHPPRFINRFAASFRPTACLPLWLALCLALTSTAARSETTVDTFHSGLGAFDGMTIDADGNLLATQYTAPGTGSLYKVTPEGVVSVVVSGLRGAAGVIVGPDNAIYIAEYNSNTVVRLPPSGVLETFASGLLGPIGLDFDSVGNLYVQNFNAGVVHRIAPDRSKIVFATIAGYAQGSAMAIDDNDNLYLTAYNQEQVYRVTPGGTPSVFATGGSPGYGFIRWGDGQLYLTGIGDDRIYSLCASDGCEPVVLAGTGEEGYVDGPGDEAQFNTPLGLAIQSTAIGDVLYVGDAGNTAYRRVLPIETTDVAEIEIGSIDYQLNCQPNPFRTRSVFQFQLPAESDVSLSVFDVSGRLVREFERSLRSAGTHTVEWDGLDAVGVPVRSGVYLFRLFVGKGMRSERIVKVL